MLAAATALDCDEARELQSYWVYKQSLTLGKGMGGGDGINKARVLLAILLCSI